ncbi:tripeptidyl-peptidase II Tpp2 [Branchiostoma belcheri]|nr:tripeptidyl-peptidase II Tpp2 [Branchiostoma belcheri]
MSRGVFVPTHLVTASDKPSCMLGYKPPDMKKLARSRERREASLRELKRILQDPTNPCNDFIPPRENTVYNLRKNTSSNQFKLPLSRSDGHKNSFIVRAVKDL